MNGLVGSIILAPLDVTAYTKKKRPARLEGFANA
jgi:hypothetical protein